MLASRLCLGLTLLAAGGCASAAPAAFADRFVRQGVPAVDLGGPRPARVRVDTPAPAPDRGSIAEVASRVSSAASNLESVHPELRDATFRLRLQPTAAHHLLVARVYRRLGIFDTAHDYLERSLAVNGPTPEVHDALARLWRDWGEPGIALSHAHRAVYLAPAWTVARNTLATVLYALGRRLDARKQLEEAVARDPRATYVLDNLCVLYQAEGRTREAISVCRQADAARRRTGAGPGEEVR